MLLCANISQPSPVPGCIVLSPYVTGVALLDLFDINSVLEDITVPIKTADILRKYYPLLHRVLVVLDLQMPMWLQPIILSTQ